MVRRSCERRSLPPRAAPIKLLLATTLLLLPLANPASADPCDTLIDVLRGQMSQPGVSTAEQSRLQSMIDGAKMAQSAGNLSACQAALQSPRPFRDPSRGRDCQETPDTV